MLDNTRVVRPQPRTRPDGDLDLVAEFDQPVGYLGLARDPHELERLLGCRVDLATPAMIRPGSASTALPVLHT